MLLASHSPHAICARCAQGAKLGNRTNASDAAALGRKAQTDNAALFAANTQPIVEAIRATGIKDLRGIAVALNVRGIPTARGGRWHASCSSPLAESGCIYGGPSMLKAIFKVTGDGVLVEFGSADSLAGKSTRHPI